MTSKPLGFQCSDLNQWPVSSTNIISVQQNSEDGARLAGAGGLMVYYLFTYPFE